MTICNVNQMARVREHETEGVMFPGGIQQCVAYCFAMEGVAAHERSAHAKLIEMRDDGWTEEINFNGVNMSGHTTLEKRAEAAKIRESIKRLLGEDGILLHSIHAKYALDFLQSKYDGMYAVVPFAHEKLNTGHYSAHRGNKYVADVVSHVCASPKKREECSVMAISRLHQVNHDRVSRDAVRVNRFINDLEKQAFAQIVNIFAISGIIPLHCCTNRGTVLLR